MDETSTPRTPREWKLTLDQALERRRAQRHFRSDPIPEGVVAEIVELANHTPSGFNICPIRVVAVSDPASKAQLRAACFNQPQIEEAPVTLVVLGDREAWQTWPEQGRELQARGILPEKAVESLGRNVEMWFSKAAEAEKALWVQRQGGLYSMSLMILTEAFGLNSCPMEGFVTNQVRAVVNAPDNYEVCLVLPIGYGTHEKTHWGRPPLEKVLFFNKLD